MLQIFTHLVIDLLTAQYSLHPQFYLLRKPISKMLRNQRIIQLVRQVRKFATESKEPPLIPPPPPQGNMNTVRLAVIGSGLVFGAYVISKPPNSYDTIFDETK